MAAVSRQEPINCTLTNYTKQGTPFLNVLRVEPINIGQPMFLATTLAVHPINSANQAVPPLGTFCLPQLNAPVPTLPATVSVPTQMAAPLNNESYAEASTTAAPSTSRRRGLWKKYRSKSLFQYQEKVNVTR